MISSGAAAKTVPQPSVGTAMTGLQQSCTGVANPQRMAIHTSLLPSETTDESPHHHTSSQSLSQEAYLPQGTCHHLC